MMTLLFTHQFFTLKTFNVGIYWLKKKYSERKNRKREKEFCMFFLPLLNFAAKYGSDWHVNSIKLRR